MPDEHNGTLAALADLATIATAVIAAYAYGNYRWAIHSRMRKIEKLLFGKTQPNDDSIRVSQLAVSLASTEHQVIEAAARSKKIEAWAGQLGKEYRFRIRRNGTNS